MCSESENALRMKCDVVETTTSDAARSRIQAQMQSEVSSTRFVTAFAVVDIHL